MQGDTFQAIIFAKQQQRSQSLVYHKISPTCCGRAARGFSNTDEKRIANATGKHHGKIFYQKSITKSCIMQQAVKSRKPFLLSGNGFLKR